jgi:uncharacterized protein (DUF362 family)
MSVVEEQRQQIEQLRRRYAGRPEAELSEFLLLALEREEVVAVAFRDSLICQRLATMGLSAEFADLIRHALIWIWKDEEMHSLYTRGAILRLGRWWLRQLAFFRKTAGAIGGWSSSVQQHLRYDQAPFSRLLASSIVLAGRLGGQIPKEVLPYLAHGTFRQFCTFNADVEQAAQETWEEITRLVAQRPGVDHLCHDLRRITEDEDNHRRIFRAIAEELTPEDRMVDANSVPRLIEKIREVNEYFLPRRLRHNTVADNPLGTGGNVYSVVGSAPQDKIPLFRRLLQESRLRECIEERCRATGKSLAELRIVIKANFMMGYHRRDLSVLVDPVLVNELAAQLVEWGCRDVIVAETRNLYDTFHHQRSVEHVAAYFGFRSPHYRIVDLSLDRVEHRYARGYGQYQVSRTWKEADCRIVFGKMTSHAVEMLQGTLKPCLGVGGPSDEYLFTERLASYPTALTMLLDQFPPHFALLDAYDPSSDGLLGMVGCARPITLHRLFAAKDALALDRWLLQRLGVDLSLSTTIQMAVHWFGDPQAQTQVVGEDGPIAGFRTPISNDWHAFLSMISYTVFESYSGRGSLFVPQMDERAFPAKQQASWGTRKLRDFVRWVCGIRLPRYPQRARESRAG